MRTIAIVGTSTLTEEEKDKALLHIENIIERAKQMGDKIVSGDADGIDTLVRISCSNMEYDKNFIMIKALTKSWGGKYGFKERNISIAEKADYIYSITTKKKDEECYHCNKDHQRTGGCFTLKHGRKLNKTGEVIVI